MSSNSIIHHLPRTSQTLCPLPLTSSADPLKAKAMVEARSCILEQQSVQAGDGQGASEVGGGEEGIGGDGEGERKGHEEMAARYHEFAKLLK